MYARAAQKYAELGCRPPRKSAYTSTFVKFEKLNFTEKPDAVPRVIQPRTPLYNLALGLYLKRAESDIVSSVAEVYGEATISKGLNCFEVGELVAHKWNSFVDPVAVGLDATRFDQHVSPAILRWEHNVYKRMYGNDSELSRLLSWQLENIGFVRCADGEIRYKVNGCRMSGDMNTGMGNCLIMTAMVYSYLQEVGLQAKLINNGDDCVLFLSRGDLHKLQALPAWFANMGFPMEVEKPVYVLEKVVFCQTQPVFDGKEWRMVRDPHLCLSKDRYIMKSDKCHVDDLRYSIGRCGMALAGDLPVYCTFYKSMTRIGKPTDLDFSGFTILATGLDPRDSEVTDQARVSFWKAFDIMPDMQLAMESQYAEVVHPPHHDIAW
jgi:hypothetical protein